MAKDKARITAETLLQLNRDTAEGWQNNDIVLEEGEPALLLEGSKPVGIKYGDGKKRWSELELTPLTVDSEYNAESDNPQSGKAVAEALKAHKGVCIIGEGDPSAQNIEAEEGNFYLDLPILKLWICTYKTANTIMWGEVTSSGGGDSKDGVSPTVEVTETANGHNVSITDVNGTKSFEVKNGKDGDPYTLTEEDKTEIVDELKSSAPVKSVNGKTGAVSLSADDVGARPSTWTPTYTEVGAEKSGTASLLMSNHNIYAEAHNDIRLLILGLSNRLDALANSDDTTLDQMAELVAYIKANRNLIEQITTGKISVTDIVDNLTTNVANKPLSASQGARLKNLIDAIVIPTKLADLSGDATHRVVTDAEKNTWNNKSDFSGAYADLTGKPTIPTVPSKVSAFENDKGYLTSHQDISGKADKSSAETWTFTLKNGNTVTKKVVLA